MWFDSFISLWRKLNSFVTTKFLAPTGAQDVVCVSVRDVIQKNIENEF